MRWKASFLREQSYIARGLFRERGTKGGNYVMGIDGVKNALLAITERSIRIQKRVSRNAV